MLTSIILRLIKFLLKILKYLHSRQEKSGPAQEMFFHSPHIKDIRPVTTHANISLPRHRVKFKQQTAQLNQKGNSRSRSMLTLFLPGITGRGKFFQIFLAFRSY